LSTTLALLTSPRYVKDILKNTSRSTDQVIIQPDGKWNLNDKKAENTKQPRRPNGVASDSEDDLVEITKEGGSVKMGAPQLSKMANGVLSQASRELSSARESVGSTSSKRPISAVIDLTSSGDEDDEPITRPAKRQFNENGYGAPSTSVPAYRPAPPPGVTYPPPHI
jgi:E3 SUMO-protein ligase PIAS1